MNAFRLPTAPILMDDVIYVIHVQKGEVSYHCSISALSRVWSPSGLRGRSAGSVPEQRLVIEANGLSTHYKIDK